MGRLFLLAVKQVVGWPQHKANVKWQVDPQIRHDIKWEVGSKTGMKTKVVGPKTSIISNERWPPNRYEIK